MSHKIKETWDIRYLKMRKKITNIVMCISHDNNAKVYRGFRGSYLAKDHKNLIEKRKRVITVVLWIYGDL